MVNLRLESFYLHTKYFQSKMDWKLFQSAHENSIENLILLAIGDILIQIELTNTNKNYSNYDKLCHWFSAKNSSIYVIIQAIFGIGIIVILGTIFVASISVYHLFCDHFSKKKNK